ncbi:MAG: biopolymer transporter ExbD [Planctomycetota bacterium]
MSGRRDDATLAQRRLRAMLREASGGGVRLNMTPMIDVVFLLLIYFVLVADFARPSAVAELDVVRRAERASDDPFALPEVPSTIGVTSVGQGRGAFAIASEQALFVGDDFDGAVRMAVATLGADHPVIVRPGVGARWEHAVVVYRTLRGAGFVRVELATEDL